MTQGAKVLAVAPATAEEERAVARSVETALVLLLNECPYYAHIAHALRLRVTRAVPTAAVSLDMRLFINPDYWEGIEKWRTRAAVLAHEISHVLYAHIERRGVRIPFPWQISSDLEINDNLAVDGWPIQNAIYAESFSLPPYRTADWYYERLIADAEKVSASGSGSASDPGNDPGSGMDGNCLSPEEDDGKGPSWGDREALRDQTAREVRNYARAAKKRPGAERPRLRRPGPRDPVGWSLGGTDPR